MDHEEVLSLDLEDRDYLYRIQRGRRIVYVQILDPDLVPRDDRTDSSRILARLRGLPAWSGPWETLTVTTTARGVSCQAGLFPPHRLAELPARPAARYDILDLVPAGRISDRVSFVRRGTDAVCVLKIARFAHELRALRTEVTAYSVLESHGFPYAPRFLGYVYEETRERVVGFLMEALCVCHPGVEDLATCQDVMERLHAIGMVHGDLNKFNIVLQDKTAKLIDFEVVTFRDSEEYLRLEREEAEGLAQKLADTSQVGDRGI